MDEKKYSKKNLAIAMVLTGAAAYILGYNNGQQNIVNALVKNIHIQSKIVL